MPQIVQLVHDHLIGLSQLSIWRKNYPKCAQLIANKLPTQKRIQSGDLAEILATEWVQARTGYSVPIKRLQFKDDRNVSMRGDDLIAYRLLPGGGFLVLKLESKSRAKLAKQVMAEAIDSLVGHSSRPNPSSLGFVASRLRASGRDDVAEFFEKLQINGMPDNTIEHMVFLLCGNNPTPIVKPFLVPVGAVNGRHVVAVRVVKHQQFIQDVFTHANA